MEKQVDEIMQAMGIKDYDDLTEVERETYHKMLDIAQSAQLSLDDYKSHINAMKQSVEFALSTEKLRKEEDLFLKARLKNYILLEAFFDRPERARKMLDQYKKRIK